MEKWEERESVGWVILFLSLRVCAGGVTLFPITKIFVLKNLSY